MEVVCSIIPYLEEESYSFVRKENKTEKMRARVGKIHVSAIEKRAVIWHNKDDT